MSIIDSNLRGEFHGLEGYQTVKGPALVFKVKIRNTSTDRRIVFTVVDAVLTMSRSVTQGGYASTPDLQVDHPFLGSNGRTPHNRLYTLDPSGEALLSFTVQFDPASFQRFIDLASRGKRVFSLNIQLLGLGFNPQAPSSKPPTIFENGHLILLAVAGKIDGVQNVASFQVSTDDWIKAVEGTRSAMYLQTSVLIGNLWRSDIKTMADTLREAERLLLQGNVKEAVAKAREITETLGRKDKGVPDRYGKLKEYDIGRKEREALKAVLDGLWSWSSKGHHRNPGGEEVFTEEQARVSIQLGYIVVGYLGSRERVGSADIDTEPQRET